MDLPLPASLDWLRREPPGQRWLAGVPARLADARQRWDLRLGTPYPGGMAGLAIPVQRGDGTRAVLKVVYPDPENRYEAAALAHWRGHGAVRLLDQADAGQLMLLESCDPGTPLSQLDEPASLAVLIGLLPRLWVPAGTPFDTLSVQAGRWAERISALRRTDRYPRYRRLLAAAADLLGQLTGPPDAGPPVLLHLDLHLGNVLRAQREPWLAIDPKPVIGEPAAGLAPIVRGGPDPRPEQVRYRLDRLCDGLGLARDRVRAWTVAQSVAWAFAGDTVFDSHLAVAGWLLDDR